MLDNQIPPTPVLIKDLGMSFPNDRSKQKARYGIYKCSCGVEFKVLCFSINSGHTQSCGCLHKKVIREKNKTHGLSSHRLFNVWNNMKQRCNNKNRKEYANYGARGIKVCERWMDIENFIQDMYPTFEDGLTIDRINNDGNYEPSNCRWANNTTQHCNTRVIHSTNKSGYRGVSYDKVNKKWVAQIVVSKKHYSLGRFLTALEAAKAYDRFVIENNLEHSINGV